MPLQPIPIEPAIALPQGARQEPAGFELELEVFTGPLALLLHLIESRQLDVVTIPLGEVADAYVAHLAAQPVDPMQLADFVSVAAQLILLKSRRLLPGESQPPGFATEEGPDEEALRRRLIEYRALRDAAAQLGLRDLAEPMMRREPRESDLPEVAHEPMAPGLLAEALHRLAAIVEPEPPPPEVVPREVTIAMQIVVLRQALGRAGHLVLQQVLAECRSRTQMTVMLLATLELVRRREVSVTQDQLFGPILIHTARGNAPA
jgi:segregation and condensation protein A